MDSRDIKLIRSLDRKKDRDSSGLFVAEGEKLVGEALNSGFKVEKVYRIGEIGEQMMSRITLLTHPSPALAVIRQRKQPPFEAKPGLYLSLDSVRDPGNFGTIIRIADWFGVGTILCSPDTVDVYNPKVVQATMGAIFRVNVIYMPLPEAADKVRGAGGTVYGTFLDGEDIYGTELNVGTVSPSMIVIGNEASGISPEMASKVDSRLFIPPYPADLRGSESLNAAVATALTVAEFRRRIYG